MANARHARWKGMDLHAGLVIPAGQRDRLERVCRYVLRPPVTFERLALTADGQVRLVLRQPRADGTTYVVFAAGEWGLTFTGTVITPGGPVTLTAVSRLVVQPAGSLTGSQTSSTGGVPGKETYEGTVTVNPDCTAEVSSNVYDQSGTLIRTAKWDVVLVDGGRELYAIFSELRLPNGVLLPTIISGTAKRVRVVGPVGNGPGVPPPTGCTPPDPFAAIPGLVGVCVNGGWVPSGHPLTGGGSQP